MTSQAPAVAVIGANGYIGKMVMPIAYEALKQKRIKELRLLSRKFDPEQLKEIVAQGATTQNASYNNIAALTQALTGIDVIVSKSSWRRLRFLRTFWLILRHDGSPGQGLEGEQG